jgi:hypothetical protein
MFNAGILIVRQTAPLILVAPVQSQNGTSAIFLHRKRRDEMNLSDKLIELQALITEREGMIAENNWRIQLGQSQAYNEDNFAILARKIRELSSTEKK